MNNPESKPQAGKIGESIFGLPQWLIAVTTAVLGATGWGLIGWLAPDKSQWSFPARLVLLTLLGIALLYLVLGLLYLRLWLRSRMRRAFGVLWDRHNNPICPKCHGTLGKADATHFLCGACSATYQVYDETGGMIFIWDASRLMHERKLWKPGWGGWKSRMDKTPETK
jgi:hypothetical protein